eukprot:4002277-Prymnesium_polylepis.1
MANTARAACRRSPAALPPSASPPSPKFIFALVLLRRGSCTSSSLTVCHRRRLALLPSASLVSRTL